MIITIREPSESEMRQYLLRHGWREDKSAARIRGDEFWIACNQTEQRSLDIYTAFIEAARIAIEHEIFATAATPLSDAERTYGEETVVQKTGVGQAAALSPAVAAIVGKIPVSMPVTAAVADIAPAPEIHAQPKSKPKPKNRPVAAQGGLFV